MFLGGFGEIFDIVFKDHDDLSDNDNLYFLLD